MTITELDERAFVLSFLQQNPGSTVVDVAFAMLGGGGPISVAYAHALLASMVIDDCTIRRDTTDHVWRFYALPTSKAPLDVKS